MSMKIKKAGLFINWQRSFSMLAPFKKAKGDRDAVLGCEVVLTKVKLLNNFHENLLMADDSVSTISTVSASDTDNVDHTKTSEVNSHLSDMSKQPQMESGSDYLSTIFSDSQLPRLYKFESEDSGVELASGAHSPSTPTGSEQSLVVHSRESSCDSSNLNTDHTCPSSNLVINAQSAEMQNAKEQVDNDLGTAVDIQESVLIHRQECSSSAVAGQLHICEDTDHSRPSETSCEGEGEKHEQCEEISVSEEICSEDMRESCDDRMDGEATSVRQSVSSESLEDYMDECCRLSKTQQENCGPLGSGLAYLEHICQLIEKIGQLQKINLRLQSHICSLQKDGRMASTKEDFFLQHCICGAAGLAFQEIQKGHSRKELFPSSGTVSDLSTIPEIKRQPLISTRRGTSSDCLTPIPTWNRSTNRRSYTEGEACLLRDNGEGLSVPQRRLSEIYSWGRVKELLRRTKVKNRSRLERTSSPLKMSCPQLYRPDIESAETTYRNRNSMFDFGNQSRLDLSWLP